MPSKLSYRISFALIFILSVGLLAGCAAPVQTTPTSEPSPSQETVPTDSAVPTPTAEPASIWLIASPIVDEGLQTEFSSWLAAQAEQDGYRFVEAEEFRASDVPDDLRAVVFLSPMDGIGDLAANLPDTQFIVLTPEDLPPAENLNVIRTSASQAAFLAGYLATLNAPDFRSGALFVDGTDTGSQRQESFLNGGRYFCGRCSPVFAPIVAFPQVGLVPPGSEVSGWQAAFDALNQNRIEMLYLPAEGLQPEFLSFLLDKNIGILSDSPPPSGFESIWVATITANPLSALQSIWPDILARNGGQTIQAEVELTHINPANLSTGRAQMAEKIIPDLSSGLIVPFNIP